MEINPTELALIIGAVQGVITLGGKLFDTFFSKYFGLEKQVSNHLQHKLDEIKSCDAANADRIVKAINDGNLKTIELLAEIRGRLSK